MALAGPRTLRVLVLVQAPDADRPRGTGEAMSRFGVDRVLHARAGSVSDMARVARKLDGRPVGLDPCGASPARPVPGPSGRSS